MKPIYLDHNATTPIVDEVADAMIPYLKENFGNPSSSHYYGMQTKKAIAHARKQVAELLNCLPEEIIFTSGGTESNNYAIRGVAETFQGRGNHIITSQVEHPAVKNVCMYLENKGFSVTYLPVDKFGMVSPEDVEKAIRPGTILITIMHANNEVGTIQPIAEIAKIAKEHDILLHTDAAQSVGKIPTRVDVLGVDLLSVAGHKLYAPKGIGALFIRKGLRLQPLMIGADHESGRRAGTENVLEIVGLGKACEIARRELEEIQRHSRELRDKLWEGLKKEIPDIQLNGHPENRLPNTLNVSIPGIDANTLLDELTDIAASAGAACHTDVAEPSEVLVAMNLPLDQALGTIRFSVGRLNDESQIDRAIRSVSEAVQRLKPDSEEQAPVFIHGDDIKLTHFTHGLGCACKLRPQNLEQVLAAMPKITDANVLVSTNTADDAAVYRLNDRQAIVQTVDFFTPIVDDPYDFGAISAANSLSDIYAMGGSPIFALNIVAFPEKRLPLEVLQEILRGASDKAQEAGIPIVGGHTVEDSEPKFGLAVTGLIDPKKILTNSNARSGDVIVLTKPIGLGIITTGLKRGLVDQATKKLATEIMARLNRNAAEMIAQFEVHSCTDVTGFGLLGHLREMTVGSGIDAEIRASAVPILEQARELALADVIPGGTAANVSFVESDVTWDRDISEIDKLLLCDAQTSGGLLIAMPIGDAEKFIKKMNEVGNQDIAIIGKFIQKGDGKITVIP
ncbi:selenide, water dikinase SelD [candidate division KSB1 bacterium 4484_87]|nr:MAG: selenide, water dikinase SelD [candidate division KSB1 bacterium 4484_87]